MELMDDDEPLMVLKRTPIAGNKKQKIRKEDFE